MRVYHLLFFLFFFGNIAISQTQDSISAVIEEVRFDLDDHRNILELDDQTIESFKKDEAFNYTEIKEAENVWTRFKKWISDLWTDFWNWVFDGVEPSPFWGFVVQILPYIIIILAVIFVVWIFFKLNPGASIFGKKKQAEVYFTEDEEIIKTKDIQQLIDKAVRDKNYRLAVRYYYLLTLQKASEASIITYEFDKTNTDYITEITSNEINQQFIKVTDLYDHVWYGNFDVSEEDYKKARKSFTKLEHRLVSLKPKADD